MAFIILNNKFSQAVVTIVPLIFLTMSPLAGATKAVLCIDQEDMHILAQDNHDLKACHSQRSIHSEADPHQDTPSTSRNNHDSPCVDISVNSCDSSIPCRQVEKLLTKKMPGTLVSVQHTSLLKKENQLACIDRNQKYPSNILLSSLQTIVLLI